MSTVLANPLHFEAFAFKAITSCFPKQSGRHLQGYKDGGKRRKEYNSVSVSSVFEVICAL